MKVEGENATRCDAVRLDSYATVNAGGPLVSADDETGAVSWRNKTGEVKSLTLGPHTIRIVPR